MPGEGWPTVSLKITVAPDATSSIACVPKNVPANGLVSCKVWPRVQGAACFTVSRAQTHTHTRAHTNTNTHHTHHIRTHLETGPPDRDEHVDGGPRVGLERVSHSLDEPGT